MGRHTELKIAADIDIYFCDPHTTPGGEAPTKTPTDCSANTSAVHGWARWLNWVGGSPAELVDQVVRSLQPDNHDATYASVHPATERRSAAGQVACADGPAAGAAGWRSAVADGRPRWPHGTPAFSRPSHPPNRPPGSTDRRKV